MQKLVELFAGTFGQHPVSVEPIAGAGSTRSYYRMMRADGASFVGTAGVSRAENEAFIYMSREFARMSLPVPQVVAASTDRMRYIQTDAGTRSLFGLIADSRAADGTLAPEAMTALGLVMDSLAAFHSADVSGFDYSFCYPRQEMDHRSVMWDLNYFKYSFLKPSAIDFDEERLEDDFETLAALVKGCGYDCIMLRDCQSRNVIVGESGNVTFIDYQGARRGKRLYDVVSFLWQARAALPASLRSMLFNRYLDSCAMTAERRRLCAERLPLFVLLRTLQVLGAYGFLGLVRRKEHFLKSIPPAVDNLRALLGNGMPGGMPELARVLGAIAGCERFSGACAPAAADGLVVTVTSFSYKKGLPEDNSGNGGGFVFDCRALHNPGRYEEYRHLTGMDAPVIEFLDGCADTGRFLESAYSLTDSSVERYLSRGFTSLCVSFGCTGGRHRSVYCAEHLAAHLAEKYPVTVRLVHREQGVEKTLSGNPQNTPQ